VRRHSDDGKSGAMGVHWSAIQMSAANRTPTISPELVKDNRLFHGLSASILDRLAAELPAETAGPGQTVMSEGEPATHMFAVLNGELEVVTRGGSANEVRVALLGPGDWFGEMAILDVQPRSASVRALAPTLLLRMSGRDIKRIVANQDMAQYAIMLENVARELSRRLKVADHLIAQSSATIARSYVEQSMRPPAMPNTPNVVLK
jgi:CRP/FNR family transcriptional regulator, cyclic AMP receptor protein